LNFIDHTDQLVQGYLVLCLVPINTLIMGVYGMIL